ncbi:collagen-binding protein [Bacteroidia bacterium]|nr:collagen-binding protein [Bacteroidia bacterium]GHT81689.1 collagen-binding protein [Bacteroidia bacterium]
MNKLIPVLLDGKKQLLLVAISLVFGTLSNAATLKGTVVDPASREALVGAVVQLLQSTDTLKANAVATNVNGEFEFANLQAQNYILKISYLGYQPMRQTVAVPAAGLDMGRIRMRREAVDLEEVQVHGTAVRAAQRGDTTEFNADAYKVTQDATTEDLLKKLPGVTVENGTVKTQGEEVKKILVDGKPFFGDDPTIAIRNLPAELIDKIEVFERLSDQAQLTGFDDGEGVRAMNIVTKPNRRLGQFGRGYAGVGYDDTQDATRYSAGGNLNFFNSQRRISVIGMTNNVNQQNFASEDVAAMSSGTGGGRRGGGMQFGGTGSGVATTHALGINYSDMWGAKTEVTGSYFFNYSDKNTDKTLTRNYLRRSDTTQQYDETSNANNININHRFNLRLDHKFTENTSLLFEPAVNFSTGDADSKNISKMLFNEQLLNSADNKSNSDRHNLNLSGNLLFRHKFDKKGRTASLRVNGNRGDANTNSNLDNRSYFATNGIDETRIQSSKNPTNNWGVRSNASYTEPLGEQSMLQGDYDVNYSFGESNKRTYNMDANSSIYNNLDSLYSNIYSNDYLTQRVGVRYRYRTEKTNASAGIGYQVADLDGTQTLPHNASTKHTFSSWLPNARVEHKFTKQQTLRLFYRASTNAPSISQLQDVVNNSNTLLLSSGNPDLRETNSHTLSLRYNQTTIDNGATFFAMLFGSMTDDYITNSTVTAREDIILRRSGTDTVWLRRGSQFSQPVNIDGYFNTRAAVNFGIPVGLLKSNLNISSLASYSRQPGYVNGEWVNGQIVNGDLNIANSYLLNLGLALGSNISEFVDFNVGYNATYNATTNTLRTGQNNTYFLHNANARLNWIFWKGFTFTTNVQYDQYRGLSSAYNEEFLRWDAGFGKKFLNNQAEIKLMVYDIFNTSKSYNRSVTESYIEDAFTTILSRYFMLTFTYTLRNFGTPPKRTNDGDGDRPPRGGFGGPPPPQGRF